MLIAGIDEVGRGCIAGAVIAAAVILDPAQPIGGLTDSKKLTAGRRQQLAGLIKRQCLAWAVGRAEPHEIDRINILQASLLAMSRAFTMLSVQADRVLVDGNFFPPVACPGETVIKGDLTIPVISAASILAKVVRDDEMQTLDLLYPGYEFSRHKGYPTKLHLQMLQRLGVTEMHRTSYKPVQTLLTDSCSRV